MMMATDFLLFGGAFDPPHIGHIASAFYVKELKGFERLIIIPTGVAPHKQTRKATENSLRKQMLELALKNYSGWEIESFEMEHSGVVCFYQTLEFLKKKYSDANFSFLIGSDWISGLSKWKNWNWIKTVANPICMTRPGYEIKNPLGVEVIEVPSFEVSSSILREKLANGLYDDELVQKSIDSLTLAFIRDKGLYKNVASVIVR